MGAFHSALLGTLQPTFAIGAKAKQAIIDASGLTANRTITPPDFSGTLALLQGTQTFTGLKTFAASALTVGGPTMSSAVGIELGATDGVTATTPYIDFHSGATATDYDARIIASGGDGTAGNGVLRFIGAGGLFIGPAGSNAFVDTGSAQTITAAKTFTATPVVNKVGAAATAQLNIIGDGGQFRLVRFGTGSGATSPRWDVGADNGAESGSNAGSAFYIHSFDDTGTFIARPFQITRATGLVTIGASGMVIAPTVLTVGPFAVTGAFTGNGRVGAQFTNTTTDTSNSYIVAKWNAGATANGQVGQIGAEYTAAAIITGRTIVENIAGSGLGFGALAAGTDFQFYGGSGRTLLTKIDSTGNLFSYGANTYGDDKAMFQYSDTWLRLNPANDFTNGIYAGTGLFRTDGQLQVGTTNANGFYVTASAMPQWKGATLGFLGVVYALKTANYTFVSGTDNDRGAAKNTATAITFTLPATGVFGEVYPFANINATGNLTIAAGTGGTLRLGGSTTTGNRTVAPWGYGSATCVVGGAAPVWLCAGPGVT